MVELLVTGTVIGAVSMAGFYTVFDRKNDRVGFAATNCKNAKENEYTVTGPHHFTGSYLILPNNYFFI